MRPRAEARGNALRALATAAHNLASMRPRAEARGNAVRESEERAEAKLQ